MSRKGWKSKDVNIVGVGSDLMEIKRLATAGEKYGDRLYQRVFTEAEIAYCESRSHPHQHYAARFAAKEAVFKALGSGWAQGVSWMDVEVIRQEKGPPSLRISGVAKKLADGLGVSRTHLSLSHTRELAMANVVLEGTLSE
jgi:holo-[acyl-carrier protein] synthase